MKNRLTPLVAIAMGDAYALPFEYRKGTYVSWRHLNDGTHFECHPVFYRTTKPGNMSDDGQLSAAVTLNMLNDGPENLAAYDRNFVEAFQRNPKAGYSRGMTKGFRKAIKEDIPLAKVCEEFGRTEKSGAAMRATTIGLLPNWQDVARIARLQGSITHTGSALLAAEIAALAAHCLYYRLAPRAQLVEWLKVHVSESFDSTPWQGRVGSPGMESARAAITAVVQATSLRDLLIRCVAFTGDVDTIAAIAMGIACHADDLLNDIPDALYEGLENGRWGRDWLHEIDLRLLARYPRPQA